MDPEHPVPELILWAYRRGIFPMVQFCTAGGIERASDDDVANVYSTLMEERTR